MHHHHIHAGHMDDIDTCLAALTLDVTPQHVAALCREVLGVTHQDAARNQSTTALVNIIKLQNQVIKRQHNMFWINRFIPT